MAREKRIDWSDPDETSEYGIKRSEAERARALVDETRDIEMRQKTWHDMNLWNGVLYSNRELPGFNWGVETTGSDNQLYPANLVTENLVKSIGDAMISKASTSPLKPTPVPRGASFETRKKIKRLDKWLFGVWKQLGMEDLAVKALLDAFVSGIGVIKVDYDKTGLVAESVFFDNIIVDNREAQNRGPITTHRIRSVVPCEAVEKRYGVELEDGAGRDYVEYRGVGDGWVVMVEAWRLPCGDDPGRHCIAVGDRLVVDEPWTMEGPPLIYITWEDNLSGFLGASGVEQVVPYQVKLNDINDRIKDAQDLTVNPRLLIHAGSKIDVNSIDNVPGRLIMYTGQEPKPLVWPAVPSEFYNERERVVDSCYQFFGISQMSAQSELPQGVRLDSSKAINEARAMEDTRFLRLWTRFEKFRMAAAELLTNVMIHDPQRDHKTVWSSGGRARIEEIVWSEIKDLKKDMFSWSMEALPMSAASAAVRRESLQAAAAEGLIGPDELRLFMSAPDLERVEDLEMASIRDIWRHLELLEDGDFEPPDELTNLTYGVPKVIYNLLDLRTFKGVPAEVFELHYEWIRTARAIMQMAVTDPTSQAPGPGPAMGMAGVEMPNNNQGLPGQPFAGAPTAPAAPMIPNGGPSVVAGPPGPMF